MSDIYQKLEEICGSKNVSNKELDLLVYNSDLASLPPVISKLYNIKPAEYVVRPSSTSQISEILKLANEKKIPITLRAGASAGLGGALAISGGIILDLTSLDKIIGYDDQRKFVTVETGVTWKKLIKYLQKFNRKIGIHPSSSPSATIGGFIASGGYAGIGAPKFGPISEQVRKLEILLPSGEMMTILPPFSSIFIGSEGTLGIVTKISLQTYPIKGIAALTFGFKNMRFAIQSIKELLTSGVRPYHLMLVDKHFLNLSRKLGITIPKLNSQVFIALEGSIENLRLQKEKISKILTKGESINGGFASEEWDRRYNAELFVKRAGPSMILLEIGISLADVPEFIAQYKELCEEKNIEIGFVGILGHGNTMLCMPFLLADERKVMDYLNLLSLSRKIMSIGLGVGGNIYGVGLHNSPYLKYVYSSETLEYFKELKEMLDPNNILNPGKIIESKVPDQLAPPPPRQER